MKIVAAIVIVSFVHLVFLIYGNVAHQGSNVRKPLLDGVNIEKLSGRQLQKFLEAEDEKLIGEIDIWAGKQALKMLRRQRRKRVPPVVVAGLWIAGRYVLKSVIRNTLPKITKHYAKKQLTQITKQYFKRGNYNKALKDFERFRPTNVKLIKDKHGYGLVNCYEKQIWPHVEDMDDIYTTKAVVSYHFMSCTGCALTAMLNRRPAFSCNAFELNCTIYSVCNLESILPSTSRTVHQGRRNFCTRIDLTTPISATYIHLGVSISRRTSLRFDVKLLGNVVDGVHVILKSEKSTLNPGYMIIIGGWMNTKSCIRRIIGYGLPCMATHYGSDLGPHFIKPWWIDWMEGHIRVGSGNMLGSNVIMDYIDPTPHTINYGAVRSAYYSGAEWVIYLD